MSQTICTMHIERQKYHHVYLTYMLDLYARQSVKIISVSFIMTLTFEFRVCADALPCLFLTLVGPEERCHQCIITTHNSSLELCTLELIRLIWT